MNKNLLKSWQEKLGAVTSHDIMLVEKCSPFGVACLPVFDKVKLFAKEKSGGRTLHQAC